MEDHSTMPGIQGGDLGSKIGYVSKENGWMSFNQVRIPRTNMLSKFTHVDREGNFEIRGDIRVLYSTMLFIRVMLIRTACFSLFGVLTISLRYASVRRQFSTIKDSKKERRLIDYQTHQYKLLPLLALAYT
jgi:alkylation response protein AidB-like acyl-CoA dehydrogenase